MSWITSFKKEIDIDNVRLSETSKPVLAYSEKAYMHLRALSSEEECIQCTAVSAKVFPGGV